MAVTKEQEVRLALPGKGALEASTLSFLAECGMKVNRSNPRQYLARIASMPGLEVVFQRAADIPMLVLNGDATLGITGYDILAEHLGYSDDEIVDGDNGRSEEHTSELQSRQYLVCRLLLEKKKKNKKEKT